jgi:hypothetical protein
MLRYPTFLSACDLRDMLSAKYNSEVTAIVHALVRYGVRDNKNRNIV